jgi:hypothetical protein
MAYQTIPVIQASSLPDSSQEEDGMQLNGSGLTC